MLKHHLNPSCAIYQSGSKSFTCKAHWQSRLLLNDELQLPKCVENVSDKCLALGTVAFLSKFSKTNRFSIVFESDFDAQVASFLKAGIKRSDQ